MTELPPNKEAPPRIEIADAVPDDAPGISALFYKTWLATYPNEEAGITRDDIEDSFKDQFSEERMKKSRERLENIPANERRFVAKADGKVVGVLRIIREEERNKLQTLYVLPGYQGTGIGTRLWEEAKKFLDQTKDTFLEVATYNENAIGFYEQLGFEDTGKRLADERFRMKSGSIVPEMEMRLKAVRA